MAMLGSVATSALASVVLPAPEGDDITRRMPRRGIWVCADCLFNVLHLLAELIDNRLQFKSDCRQGSVRRFRAQRIGLAVEFLREKIELAADRLGGAEKLSRRFDMGKQAVDLLLDIGAHRKQCRLLMKTILVEVRARLHETG